jgi:hypothetical protein
MGNYLVSAVFGKVSGVKKKSMVVGLPVFAKIGYAKLPGGCKPEVVDASIPVRGNVAAEIHIEYRLL